MRRIDDGFFKTCVHGVFILRILLFVMFFQKKVVSRIPLAHSHLQYM